MNAKAPSGNKSKAVAPLATPQPATSGEAAKPKMTAEEKAAQKKALFSAIETHKQNVALIEEQLKNERARFLGELAPYEGVVIKHGEDILKVVKSPTGYTLRNMESAALRAAREELA